MTGDWVTSGELRREQLAAGLTAVRQRIAAACLAAGRAPHDVLLVAVTKTWPAGDVALLAGLGVADVGENRDQEAAGKTRELAGVRTADGRPLRWHFVGQLQTNKAASVAGYATVVHSVDRARLARALSRGAERAGRTLDVLLQVRLPGDDEDDARGGADARAVPGLADLAAGLPGLRLAGVMAVAPAGGDPGRAFAALAQVAEGVRRDHPGATAMSAGMSGDLEAAVRAGATHVRVGTALLGHRPALLR